jgi:ubiquinone/menaquinone biosynthesis C-methylase UbiE
MMLKKIAWALGAISSFAASTYVVDVVVRRKRAAKEARAYADSVNKPMLNVGCGASRSALFGKTNYGDVNCDISLEESCLKRPNGCRCNIMHLDFPDKYFGSVLASHVLEHVSDPIQARNELHRVADKVWIIVPSWWAPHTWLYWQHQWYFPKGDGEGTPIPLWRSR